MTFVLIRSETNLYTVGHFDPSNTWHPIRDFNDKALAEHHCAWLNGGAKTAQSSPKLSGLIKEAMQYNNELTAILTQLSVWTKGGDSIS